MIKTGLYFGSFNPVHIGHLVVANYMVAFTDIDELWFVVSPQNPLKEKEILAPDPLRLRMAELATANDSRLKVSDVEFSMPTPSYTIDTLQTLGQRYPDREFSIVMGSDGLPTFNQWKNYQALEQQYKRYVYPRPGCPIDPSLLNVIKTDAPQMNISSTFIRQAIAEGKDVRYFLPSGVWDFLKSHRLYQLTR